MRPLTTLIVLIIPALSLAEQPAEIEASPEPPDIPMPVQSGETLEPDITIIRRGDKTIQEYRINGELYKVKIIPDIGPPYYMIDTDGDGNMEVREMDLNQNININQWKIYSW